MLMNNTKTVQAPDEVTFLIPHKKKHATKIFSLNEDGKPVVKEAFDKAYRYKGISQQVDDLYAFFEILKVQQDMKCFIVLGGIIDGTDTENMRRILRTDKGDDPTIEDRPVHIFCLDVDGYDGTPASYIKDELPEEFGKADYIIQYSASHGFKPGLRCHLYFWLEKPAMISDIRAWVQSAGIKGLDPSVCIPVQPIFTQTRICEGFDDPIDTPIEYVYGKGNLRWAPEHIAPTASRTNKEKQSDYVMETAVANVVSGDSYHDNIRSTALSWANRGMSKNTIMSLLKGLMRGSTKDEEKDERWRERFNDIERAVDSAIEIVKKPQIDDFCDWVLGTDRDEVEAQFGPKCIHFSSLDLTRAVNAVMQKTGHGIRDVRSMVKEAKDDFAAEMAELAKKDKTAIREKHGIHEIELTPEWFNIACDRSCRILSESEKGAQVFKNGSGLVRIEVDYPKTIHQCSEMADMDDVKDYPKMPLIKIYSRPFSKLQERLGQDIIYVDAAGREIYPNSSLLNVVGEGDHKAFKPLSGVVEHPYIDRKWRLRHKDGYDHVTGLYSMLHHKLTPKRLAPKPAYKYLTDVVLDEFPFGSELDKAVAVAAMMTAVQRPTISGNSGLPGFGIVSPKQSSGKTTLAQLISHAIYNRPVAAQSWTYDEEEMGKHILGILQEGHSCVLFDNIKQGSTVTSDRLATAMTNDIFTGRQLGENKTIRVASSCLWLFTGNNIQFVGDFATRIYPINIVPLMESPDGRKFKDERQNIGKWAMDNRKHIMSAVLSIIAAGKDLPEMNGSTRFKEWDVFVRRPLFHASGIDVNAAVKKNQTEDPERMAKYNVIEKLYEHFGNKQFTTRDIMASMESFDGDIGKDNDLAEALKGALDTKAKNSTLVGKYLGTMVDDVLGEYRLTKYVSNVVKWQVVKSLG